MSTADEDLGPSPTVHHQLALPCGHDVVLPTDASTPQLSVLILAHQSQCDSAMAANARDRGRPSGILGGSVADVGVALGGYA